MIDPGSSHSFISCSLASRLGSKYEPLGFYLRVSTPFGDVMVVNVICRDCLIQINESILSIDLVVLPINEFDVILGIDWLTKYLLL